MNMYRRNHSKVSVPALIVTLLASFSLLLVLACSDEASNVPEKSITLVLATGSKGGTFAEIGKGVQVAFRRSTEARSIQGRIAVQHTEGTPHNVEMLVTKEADIALASGHGLTQITSDTFKQIKKRFEAENDKREINPSLEEIRVIAELYPSYLQIIARKDFLDKCGSPTDLSELCKNLEASENGEASPPTFFLGDEKSAVNKVAKELLHPQLGTDYVVDSTIDGYSGAAQALIDNRVQLAFFFAGIPTTAVEFAMQSDLCEFISPYKRNPDGDVFDQRTQFSGIRAVIPALTYAKQKAPVESYRESNYIICRSSVSDEAVREIVKALADEVDTLRYYHPLASQIRAPTLVPAGPVLNGIKIHGAAKDTHKSIKQQLVILAGRAGGSYYETAKSISRYLRLSGVACRVQETGGSRENLELLRSRPNAMALAQHDATLTFLNDELGNETTSFDGQGSSKSLVVRRIGVVHDEFLFAFAKKPNGESQRRPLSEILSTNPERVALGPQRGGTRSTLKLLVPQSQIDTANSDIEVSRLSAAFQHDLIDAAAICTTFDNAIVQSMLSQTDRVIPIDILGFPHLSTRSPALEPFEMPIQFWDHDEGRFQTGTVRTLTTKTLLVCNETLPEVRRLTEAIYSNAQFLGTTPEMMAVDVEGIDMHSDSLSFLRDEQIVSSPPEIDYWSEYGWILTLILSGLTICGTAIAGWNGYVAHCAARDVLKIDLSATTKNSAGQLNKVEERIRKRVGNAWLRWGVVSPARWSSLQELIDLRKNAAHESSFQALIKQTRQLDAGVDFSTTMSKLVAIEKENWALLESGEIQLQQFEYVDKVVHHLREKTIKAVEDSTEVAGSKSVKLVREIIGSARECCGNQHDEAEVIEEKEAELWLIGAKVWSDFERGELKIDDVQLLERVISHAHATLAKSRTRTVEYGSTKELHSLIKQIRENSATSEDNIALLTEKEQQLRESEEEAWRLLENSQLEVPQMQLVSRLLEYTQNTVKTAKAKRRRKPSSTK